MVKRALRALSSPVRSFFNDHFNMVKGEITLTREQVLGGGGSLARATDVVELAAEKMRDSVTFVGLRLGRLEDGQAALAAAVARLERGAGAATADPAWVAFVVRHLTLAGADGDVVVAGAPGPLGAALAGLGYTVTAASVPAPLAIVVDATTIEGTTVDELVAGVPTGTLVITRRADGSDPSAIRRP